MQNLLNPAIIWFIIGLVLLLTELFAPALVMLFFGLGAWCAALAYFLFKVSLSLQLAVFLVASTLFLVLIRKKLQPIFQGYVASKQSPEVNLDDFIGKEATVVEKIDPGTLGKVEFKGVLWAAGADSAIAHGARVRITGRDGLKLVVKPL